MDFDLTGKRFLITGATGLIGGSVARRLIGEGHRVRVMARTPAKAAALGEMGAEVVRGDMIEPELVRRAVEGCAVVIHCAGVIADEFRPLAYYRAINVEGTRHLAEAALQAGVERFVHVSSITVYGFKPGAMTNEQSPHIVTGDPYSDTKLEGEAVIQRLIKARGLPAVIVQPSQVYGPGDEAWTASAIRLIRSGTMILPGGGRGQIQPITVGDVTEGVLAALRRGPIGERYILTGPAVVTIGEFMTRLASIVGRGRPPSVPAWLAMAIASAAEVWVGLTRQPPAFHRAMVRATLVEGSYDGSKAQRELGFRAQTDLDTGMEQVRQWLGETEAPQRASEPAGG